MDDPILCCLLGVCCPPLQRREKLVRHFEALGIDAAGSERAADDLIARFDVLLATGFGAMLKQVRAHGKGHKD